MEFIGRKDELSTLQKEYSRKSGFVVIYGRRRVGKTTLIKEFIKDKNALYFLATEEAEALCISRFANEAAKYTKQQYLQNVKFTNWYDLFDIIVSYHQEQKKIIIIDEFPYLVKVNPAFPSILQNIWDERLKDNNVMFILCGSFISMMQKYALSYESPLYGRRTSQIRLKPLSFSEIYAYTKISKGNIFEKTVEEYAVTGGVPKYMEFFNNDYPLMKTISDTILNKNGFLYEEPAFLLKEEIREPITYFSIIRSIAMGSHKLGKIANDLNVNGNVLTPYISALIDLGYLNKQVPVTEDNPEKSKKGLYTITDNFMRFWFCYVYPFKGELEFGNSQIVFEEISKDFVSKFTAFAYENICKDIFKTLCSKSAIPFTPSKIGSYWLSSQNQSIEIDVMSIDNTHKIVFSGECKYHEKPVDADVYFDLKKKTTASSEIQNTFRGYTFIYGLFSKSGFTPRLLDIASNNNDVYLINEDFLV